MSETNWQARRDAVVAADGDAWDRLSKAAGFVVVRDHETVRKE